MSKFSTHIEFPVGVEYAYHKGTPGKLSGPPENCCPPEPSWVEIIAVMVGGVDVTEQLSDAQMTTLEQEIENKVTGEAAAAEQDYWDAERERQRDERYERSEVIQEDCQ